MEKEILKLIRKIEWRYLVNRKETVLCRSIIDNCNSLFPKLTGIPWVFKYVLRLFNGDMFHRRQDLDWLQQYLIHARMTIFEKLRKLAIIHVSKLDNIANKIQQADCKKLSQTELSRLLSKYIESALNACNFLRPMPISDKVLSNKILNHLRGTEEEKQKTLITLTFPFKENSHNLEERDFYKLIGHYGKRGFRRLLELHLKKYDWIGARGFWWDRAWDQKLVQDRIRYFRSTKKNPRKELKRLEQFKKARIKEFHKLVKELKIKRTSDLYRIILIAKEYAYLRTWRTDIIYASGYKARDMFYEIARRARLNPSDVIYLTFLEIKQMAQTGRPPVSLEELRNRKKHVATIMAENKYYVLTGNKWRKLLKQIFHEKFSNLAEVKGNPAYGGRAVGRAIIVLSGLDVPRCKKGDVLVTVMTHPNFMPAIEKAVAFVTDEGGILSHAAIVSREMKKPCVIGTKIATKVLKDGMTVEVDANRGIVRIIK